MRNYATKKIDVDLIDGMPLHHYQISFNRGISVELTNYGATIMSVYSPNKKGELENIVCGFDDPLSYVKDHPYFGCVCGRYANRIYQGKFKINGEEFELPTNNGLNHLHGGDHGFHRVLWREECIKEDEKQVVITLSFLSRDKEQGYPGNLQVQMQYIVRENEIGIKYEAITDKETIVNLTNHSYFNLSGNFNKTIFDHELQIMASHYLPVTSDQIPSGSVDKVENTPFDFRKSRNIGEGFNLKHSQLRIGNGYDHCMVIDRVAPKKLKEAASLFHEESGRFMQVLTTDPGVQFYSGNHLEGKVGKDGIVYSKHSAMCLETQHFPDSPNQPHFPTTLLKPNDKYVSETIYRFGLKQ